MALDYLPQEPNLSGEYVDSLTPRSLCAQIIGRCWEDLPNADELLHELSEAFEQGVSDLFVLECERRLVEYLQ